MKRRVFLIIGTLLVLGLVLPGCDGGGGEVIYTFEGGQVIVGICADIGHVAGDFNKYGIMMAESQINVPGINIGGVVHTLTHVIIDTDEEADPTGVTGANALQAAITANSFDFIMGGFRTEAVQFYREKAMDAQKIFFDCGAATETLQHSVVANYDRYKYWFKFTPYNEYFLASSVLKLIDSVAIELRVALGLTPTAQLTAVIIAEDLTWAKGTAGAITPGLPALNINLLDTYIVSSLYPGGTADTVAALAAINASNPHIIIPLYSGAMGVYYDGTLAAYVAADSMCPMSVGINLYEQLKTPWAPSLNVSPPGGPYCAYHIELDTWAEGVSQTPKTAAFLLAFMTLTGLGNPALGEYPMDAAATYDACYALKACLEAVGYIEGGVGKAKADDIIAWYEDPANAQVTTTGLTTYYPRPGTTAAGKPALTAAQVMTMYPIATYGYTYVATDWQMPAHTTHDLVYGVGLQTGVGCQWQWDAVANKWKKVGIWPRVIGGPLIDQYGDWNFAYPGTVATVIPNYVIDHFTP